MKIRLSKQKRNTWPILAAILGVMLLSLLASCAPQVVTPSPGDIQTALAETLAAQPTATLTPTIAPTNTPNPSPTPFRTATPTVSPPVSGKVTSEYLNMREGPSQMFEVVETVVLDTEITAIARTLDNLWVKVELPSEQENIAPTVGWMWAEFIDFQGEISALPLDEYDPALTIFGVVQDQDGNPIPGIGIQVSLQDDVNVLPADTVSNEDGLFEVYLPEGQIGIYDVQIVSWECDSVVVNLACKLFGYVEGEDQYTVTPPQLEGITFIYEKTSLTLSGVVQDANEDPVAGMNIVAAREDGSASYAASGEDGTFTMPIAPGNWEVYTFTFDPEYTESEHVSIEVLENAMPEDIILGIP